jgi:hypothetical protein
VLRGGDIPDVGLSDDLRSALREWAEVADTVVRSGDVHEVDLLRRRGRQLASRVADVLGRPVDFVDPVSGAVEPVLAGERRTATERTASNGAATNGVVPKGAPRQGVAANGAAGNGAAGNGAAANGASGGAASDGGVRRRSVLALEPPGPTPWGPGVAVATFFAALVAIADVVLANAFSGAFGLLWVPANLLVTAGTVPSLWLAREVPFWRWPAFGAAGGLAAAWVVMLLGLLSP